MAMKEEIKIEAPKFDTARTTIIGTSKFVQHKFSAKARKQIMETQEQGSRSKKGKKREAKNFDDLYKGALYIGMTKGKQWQGFNASSIRHAMVSACRLVGFQMTKGKLGIFVEPDGFDIESGTPLVKITKGKPYRHDDYVRLANGSIDICSRPMWDEGWEAEVRITYDADMFSKDDIMNLLHRAGLQVGIGEGRPDSKNSCGCGWGTFKIQGKPGAK